VNVAEVDNLHRNVRYNVIVSAEVLTWNGAFPVDRKTFGLLGAAVGNGTVKAFTASLIVSLAILNSVSNHTRRLAQSKDSVQKLRGGLSGQGELTQVMSQDRALLSNCTGTDVVILELIQGFILVICQKHKTHIEVLTEACNRANEGIIAQSSERLQGYKQGMARCAVHRILESGLNVTKKIGRDMGSQEP
jgi:hypothetical protein